jgi:hypothetical protein
MITGAGVTEGELVNASTIAENSEQNDDLEDLDVFGGDNNKINITGIG